MKRDVFIIESRDRIVLFAPMRGLILEIKKDEKDRILQLVNKPHTSFDEVIDFFPDIDRNRLFQEKPKAKDVKEKDGFSPTSVVLFPTLDCNFRCIYCYSDAGRQKINMNWQIAKAAIEFIVANAISKREESVHLGFHGGGEPTWNWIIFQKALDLFQNEAERNNFVAEVNLATNGMLSKKQIEWMASRINSVQISLDGMEEIQNFQRPTAKGGKSFFGVSKAVNLFLAKRIKVNLHCVITDKGIDRIPEIIRFLLNNFLGTTIHLEPVYGSGRGLQTGQKFPSPKLFVDGFIEAEKIAECLGRKVFYSGAGPNLAEFHDGFCGVFSPNFVVTPSGLVTACNEVAEEAHPLAKSFIYGYLNKMNGEFVFDYEKIKNLRNYNTEIDSACQECFAKYYCAGDCLVKRLNSDGKKNIPSLNPRCEINREITRYFIFKKLFVRKEVSKNEDGSG